MNDAIAIPISHIAAKAKLRPSGYVDDVMSYAVSRDNHFVVFRRADYEALCLKYRRARKQLPPPIRTPFLGHIPDDFDPEQEKRRGGCCDPPAPA